MSPSRFPPLPGHKKSKRFDRFSSESKSFKAEPKDTSWEKVSGWYHALVGSGGQFYHREVIFPVLLKELPLSANQALLDVGCGQGVLARAIPKSVQYVGLDGSNTLILQAKQADRNQEHHYFTADATKPFPLAKKDFDAAVFVLSLQNMRDGKSALKNAVKHLRVGGKLILVLNHPCFRIPRQSSWEIDTHTKLQFRRINRYLSPLEIPITAHPGKSASAVTWSYHQPLSAYVQWLKEAGCVLTTLHELASTKESVGKAAKMENRGREEFPLFAMLIAEKR